MSNVEEFKYKPLEDDELQKLWNKHKIIIESFILDNEYDAKNIYVNENTVLSVIAKVDQRRKYFKYFHKLDMSEYKEAALICFWYIKLHPICAVTKDTLEKNEVESHAINEKLAVYYMTVTLKAMLRKNNLPLDKVDSLPKEYVKELIYSFTYRDLSKEALILLLESMAVFLGMNPYNTH